MMKSIYILLALTGTASAWAPSTRPAFTTTRVGLETPTPSSLLFAEKTAKETAKEAAYDLHEGIEDLADDAKERAGDIADDVKNAAQDAREEIDPDRTFEDKSLLGKVKEIAVDTKDYVKEVAVDTKDYVKDKAVSAKDKVKSVAGSIKEKVVGESDDSAKE